MKTNFKKGLVLLLAITLVFGGIFVAKKTKAPASLSLANNSTNAKTPKYIFLFVGDGMSYPQITSASDYLGNKEQGDKKVISDNLNFMSFPAIGTATTFDSTSFCPDSASTATSLSTGYKTHSGVINMNEDKDKSYETIAEKLKEQLDYKIGVVSSVPINHATPAAFYAHQPSRGMYYEIGLELTKSDFDYFGGGGLLDETGLEKDKESLFALAEKEGYTHVSTKEDILALDKTSKKVIATNPVLDSGTALPYAIDATEESLPLSTYVEKGIEVLDNEKGFFMMVEGGKIDWACHANDAMTSIQETLSFSESVDVALDFAKEHPKDTLILVTGDHETGGLTIGFSATGYSTYFDKLSAQQLSYDDFDEKISDYKESNAPFEQVLSDIKTNFGLITSTDPDATAKKEFVLSDYEYKKLEQAYQFSLTKEKDQKLEGEEYILYGDYDPLTVSITHILNNKAGLSFSSYSHTGLPVPVFSQGVGSDLFKGYYDNTDIFKKLQSLTKVK